MSDFEYELTDNDDNDDNANDDSDYNISCDENDIYDSISNQKRDKMFRDLRHQICY